MFTTPTSWVHSLMSKSSANSVWMTYLHTEFVSHSFMDSVARTYEYEKHHETNLLNRTFAVGSGPLTLDKSRNESVEVFLEHSECEWLWIVDSDMGFTSDTLARMVQTAEINNLVVLSALYYGAFYTEDDLRGGSKTDIQPVVFGPPNLGFPQYSKEQVTVENGNLLSVGGVGAGCILLNRSILVSMKEKFGSHWFTQIPTQDGYRVSEDLSFCVRLHEVNIPVVVDTNIKVSHHKSMWIG